ncbi:MAG: peptidase [Candidatus Paceibacter sp.]|jgi:Zn-dependent protease|nr:peptidase [Candidatus Paceibacter sp.]
MISSITIFLLIILIISVVIHEVSHGYAAYVQGDMTAYYEDRLTLNPIKHVDPIGSILVPLVTTFAGFPFGWAKPVPFNPFNLRNQRWGELWVAIAGPASNIIIALIFGGIIRFSGLPLDNPFIGLSMLVVLINLGLALFNLIPVPPLDGSKVLFAFLPYHLQKFRPALERYSFFLVLILILIPQFSFVLGTIVGFFFSLITGVPGSAIGF